MTTVTIQPGSTYNIATAQTVTPTRVLATFDERADADQHTTEVKK